MDIFNERESQIRSYIRSFPTVFQKAKGARLFGENGRSYIDFFAGAGVMNYGHNNDIINQAMIHYLQNDGVIHGLDLGTSAKAQFLETFTETILNPRAMNYKVQFTGPTGTNVIESAIKLARRVTGRANVISFTNAYHGLTLGALAHTGNVAYRNPAYVARLNATFMPFEGYLGPEIDTIQILHKFLADPSSGVDLPAAILVETVQAEGGVNIASAEWLRRLAAVCREFEILLVVDDIQVGNGRTGDFFSFEAAGISPDMVAISKAIGGGLPMSILLIKPELDQWQPGEHTGTFRGNNLAFVASVAALNTYWRDDQFSQAVKQKAAVLDEALEQTAREFSMLNACPRGRGLIYGLEIPEPGFAKRVSQAAFEKGLIIELAGATDQVVKFLPPLVIDEETLLDGVNIVNETIAELLG